jgi:hypothetical protein
MKSSPLDPASNSNLLSKVKAGYHNGDEWLKRQSRKRLLIFFSGLLAFAALLGGGAWGLTQFPHPPYPAVCATAIIVTALYLVLWPIVCFRFKQAQFDGRKIKPTKLGMWWVLTIWLSLYMAAATPAHSASTGSGAAVVKQQVSSGPTVKPNYAETCIPFWLFLLFCVAVAAVIFAGLWAICRAAGICGNRGNQPPAAPGNDDNIRSNAKADFVNPSVALPSVTFTLSGGNIISNSAGLSVMAMPPLLNLNGVGIPNGSMLEMDGPPGITTPPSIGLWIETNAYCDAILDPTHPYQIIYNYSLLSSTNLTDWHEVSTVVGWINGNLTVPLACSITYTNGTPETTNWTQFYLSGGQPTNIVVYGALSSTSTGTTQIAKPEGGITPPGFGGGCTNCPPETNNATGQFYRLTCNTNAIVTSWP